MKPNCLSVLLLVFVPLHAVHLGKVGGQERHDPVPVVALTEMQAEALPRGALATVWDSKAGDASATPSAGLLDSAKARYSAIAFLFLVLVVGCLFIAARPRMREEMKNYVVTRMSGSGKALAKSEPVKEHMPPQPPTEEEIAVAKDLQQQWLLFESNFEAHVRETERESS